MRRIILTTIFIFLVIAVVAQQLMSRQEIDSNPLLSASNMTVYPGPSRQLTPAPKGKRPFYISHYGRHGSRYMTKFVDYNYVLNTLQRAEYDGKLTPAGQDLLKKVSRIVAEGISRIGDLTPLGAEQHRDIARRMMQRFPDIFKGNVRIEARSTMVPRCILSMGVATNQLTAMNPKLNVSLNADLPDMFYLNYQDWDVIEKGIPLPVREAFDKYCSGLRHWQRLVNSVFTDSVYVKNVLNGELFNYYLFRMAGSMQNTPLGQELSIFDFFTSDEIYDNWKMENARWYLGYSHTMYAGGNAPFVQRNLLRRIIEQADSCLQIERPGATLRFGHETVLVGLASLMELNGIGKDIKNLEELEQSGWLTYKIMPMACNVQIIFYRKNPSDEDVLVKVLYNEDEATLPVDSSTAPYYKWSDVRAYYMKKLDSYGQ